MRPQCSMCLAPHMDGAVTVARHDVRDVDVDRVLAGLAACLALDAEQHATQSMQLCSGHRRPMVPVDGQWAPLGPKEHRFAVAADPRLASGPAGSAQQRVATVGATAAVGSVYKLAGVYGTNNAPADYACMYSLIR